MTVLGVTGSSVHNIQEVTIDLELGLFHLLATASKQVFDISYSGN